MGAIGAIGGVGGGLGSVGDGGSSGDVGPMAPEPAPDPTTSYTQNWFSSSSVMDTGGDVDGTSVTLDDADLTAGGVGSLGDDEQRPPMIGDDTRVGPQGLGDSPSAEVTDRVAAVYAANSM